MGIFLARRNLLHEKGKLALSVAGVAAALALILLLLGFREGLYVTLTAFVDNMGADLIVAQSGTQGMFTSDSVVPLWLHDQAVTAVNATGAGHIIIAGIILTRNQTKTPVLLVGYDPATTFGTPWNIGQGRGLDGGAASTANNEILLDTWLAQRNGIAVGDTLDVLGQTFTVVGLTRETASWMSPYVFISLDAAASILGLNNMVSYHLLRLPAGVNPTVAVATIEREVPGIAALTPTDMAAADQRVLATVMATPLNVMIFIGTVIGVAVMGLTAYTAVTDQMREYGVLKAVGASGGRLAWLVTVETLCRAVAGFVCGVGLGYVTAALIMTIWPQFNIVIRPGTIVQAGVLTMVMTALAALLPIRRLSQIDPLLVFKQ
ncbi:MAG: ABC transporter permease [Anaerolineae bacterium]|nr:ABC transporter permease [Anaerolineae bacterium]